MNDKVNHLSKENALSAVCEYLSEKFQGELTISNGVPDYASIYNSDTFPIDSWYIYVPDSTVNKLGGGRIIGICKKTGRIFYDGSDGGE